MKHFAFFLFSLSIFLPCFFVHAQNTDITPNRSVLIRLYVDTEQHTLEQDMRQEILGPSVRLDTAFCKKPKNIPGKYIARTRSENGSILLEKYPLGDLRPSTFKDSIDAKTGALTGGEEILLQGTLSICVPFSEQTALIEILEESTDKTLTSIRIRGLVPTTNEKTTPSEKNVETEQSQTISSDADTTWIFIMWALLISFCLIAGIALWRFLRKK